MKSGGIATHKFQCYVLSHSIYILITLVTRLNSIPILSAFSFIYAHIRRNPFLHSSRADIERLLNVSEYFKQHSTRTKYNASIQTLMFQIYRATSDFVRQGNTPSSVLKLKSRTGFSPNELLSVSKMTDPRKGSPLVAAFQPPRIWTSRTKLIILLAPGKLRHQIPRTRAQLSPVLEAPI
jgi:hypothetical protein